MYSCGSIIDNEIDYQKIIHNLLRGEIKVLKKVKKIEKKYKEIEEEKNGNN